MRCVAGAGLVVLVGCNQVFGIHKTEPYDAAPDVIADRTYVKLTSRVAGVLPSGAPDLEPVDLPIAPAPRVRYAALDQAWQDASYDPDGTVTVARELFAAQPDGGLVPWRFEYTLSDGVPHEVQWAPEDKHGQLAIPLFGRAVREVAPSSAGYDVAPIGVNPLQSPRVFTTGLWTEGIASNHNTASVTYSFGSAVSMSGPRGRPDPAQGDRAFVIDYGIDDPTACRFATGSAVLASAALEASGHSTPMATWDASKRAVSSANVAPAGHDITRFGAIASLGGAPVVGSFSFGYAASAVLAGLPGVPRSAQLPVSTVLPTPVMLTILQCPYKPLAMAYDQVAAAQPAALDPFSRIMHVQLYSTRTVDGVALVSGMESATLGATFTGFVPTFPAAIPVAVQLEAAGGGMTDLLGPSEGVAVGPPGRFTVHITPEAEAGVRADYYDVTLHRFDAGGLTTERIYTVISPEVVLDAASLAPAADYVLEIRSFRGHPNVRQGDFRQVEYPYGSAILFTRKFHTS